MGTRAEILRSLHESAAHSGQLEAWQADLKAFDELKADHEDELRRVRGEAYGVATLYAAFQGVIFTAIAQASLLTCQLWWCPVSLSVAVSIATFLAIADKLHSMGELHEAIKETDRNIAAVLREQDVVEEQGSAVDLETVQPVQLIQRQKLAGYRFIASRDGISALLLLTFFSVLVASFSFKSLCNHCPRCA